MKRIHLGVGFWLVLGGVIIGGLVVWGIVVSSMAPMKKYRDSTTREVAMICTTDMATQFHIHPELTIIIDGEKQVIPANIGITSTCMNSIHTHDALGTLHVESPVKRDFLLADFFAVWDKAFTKDQVLDKKIDGTHEIVMTVNGKPSQDFENLILKDKDQIVIEYKAK